MIIDFCIESRRFQLYSDVGNIVSNYVGDSQSDELPAVWLDLHYRESVYYLGLDGNDTANGGFNNVSVMTICWFWPECMLDGISLYR